MNEYISTKQASAKWKISQRRVAILCSENRINGANMVGNMWIIPSNVEKPIDKRLEHCSETKSMIKPFVKWAGGKSQLLDRLEKLASIDNKKYRKYAEPFVGGGAFLFKVLSKYDFDEIFINDINQELINVYKTIKASPDLLIDSLMELQENYLNMDEIARKKLYYSVRADYNNTKLTESNSLLKATYFVFLNKTCFNGLYRVNRNGQFNVPIGAYKKPTICDKANLTKVSKSLQKVSICCGDYSEAKKFIDNKTFVYLDPPYRPLSKTANFTSYNIEEFNDKEQIRLFRFFSDIDKIGAKIILSNSDPKNENEQDDFFEVLYKNYTINKVEATRMINSNSDKRGKINELLICNFEDKK